MSLKSVISPHIAACLTSRHRVLARRRKVEARRRKSGAPHLVEFFHDPSDPYSQLLDSVIGQIKARYHITLETHLVGPPDDAAAPEREALAAYALKDAGLLAGRAGVSVDFRATSPALNTEQADRRRDELGHYLGGMLYYGEEWYWGLDRLHYLEDRLTELGARREGAAAMQETAADEKAADEKAALGKAVHGTGIDGAGVHEGVIFPPPETPCGHGKAETALHWYLSLRSPYTIIVADRIKALADAYGADLKLRFVLPMVMRALPVPKHKRQYIIDDTAREAHRLGVPFGRVCDPVGRPVERAYSILPWAIEEGRGFDFVASFIKLVWSEGVDAGSDRGLRRITEQAGLNWAAARRLIGSDDWRAIAENNRQDMMAYGIWGVPSFRVGDVITWGQDRLWVIEEELQRLSAPATAQATAQAVRQAAEAAEQDAGLTTGQGA